MNLIPYTVHLMICHDLVATGGATIHRKIPKNGEEPDFAEVGGRVDSYVIHFLVKIHNADHHHHHQFNVHFLPR